MAEIVHMQSFFAGAGLLFLLLVAYRAVFESAQELGGPGTIGGPAGKQVGSSRRLAMPANSGVQPQGEGPQWSTIDKKCVGPAPWTTNVCRATTLKDNAVYHITEEGLALANALMAAHDGAIPYEAAQALRKRSDLLPSEQLDTPGAAARFTIERPPLSDGHLHVLVDRVPCARWGCCSLPWALRPNSTDLRSVYNHFLANEYKILLDLPLRPKYILDAGGVGMAPVFFALLYPDARILRVEPHEGNFAAGARNALHFGAIQQVNLGLWDKQTTLQMCDNVDIKWGADWPFASSQQQAYYSREPGAPPCKKVALDGIQVATLDNLMRAFNFPHFDLIKMDVEGAEAKVFARPPAARRFLRGCQLFIAELHSWVIPGAAEAVHAVFATLPTFRHVLDDENEIWMDQSLLTC